MNTPMPEGVDPSWWARVTETVAEDYCPGCEPDADPKYMMVQYCKAHKKVLSGSADLDPRLRSPNVAPYTNTIGDDR